MSELITNGDFASGTGWNLGTGWSISGGQAIAAATAVGQFLSQSVPVIKAGVYVVTYDVANYSSGDVRCSFDSGDNGTTRNANGTYTETITLTAAATLLRFGAATTALTARVDNVSLQGLSSAVDEQALGLATSVWVKQAYPSLHANARACLQAYANGGVAARVSTPLQETALSLASSILITAIAVSPEQLVRRAVTQYLSQLGV